MPGAAEYALPLESVAHAEAFRRKLLDACLRANHARRTSQNVAPVSVNIIGAGATGVELAAALRDTVRLLNRYSQFSLDPERDFRIRLIESSERVLPALSETDFGSCRAHAGRARRRGAERDARDRGSRGRRADP